MTCNIPEADGLKSQVLHSRVHMPSDVLFITAQNSEDLVPIAIALPEISRQRQVEQRGGW